MPGTSTDVRGDYRPGQEVAGGGLDAATEPSVSGELLHRSAATAGNSQGDLITHRGRALSRKRATSGGGVNLVATIAPIAGTAVGTHRQT